jgi:hypothetical protein
LKTGEVRSHTLRWVSRRLWQKRKSGIPILPSGRKITAILETLIPEFSIRMGGATSIDVTKPGIDKAYGIGKLRDTLHLSLKEMIYIGDALFPGGNDYPAEEAGVVSIPVKGPDDTNLVIRRSLLALAISEPGRWSNHGRGDSMSGFKLQRLGMIMEPEPGNPHEVEGVLNPGAVRGPDGELYLFPRLVAKGNYSRIGIARVRFNDAGDPAGVERLGIALEPEAGYELRPGGGGCEDPRVTLVEPLKRYIMTYTAFSPLGPRIAMAESEDLFHWKRLGLATYAHWHGIELGNVDDKDASSFLSRYRTRREDWNWVCSIVRFLQARGRRRLRATLECVTWILTERAFGFHTARRP